MDIRYINKFAVNLTYIMKSTILCMKNSPIFAVVKIVLFIFESCAFDTFRCYFFLETWFIF